MNKNIKTDIDKEFTEHDEISFRYYAVYVVDKVLASGLDLEKIVDIATDMFVELTRVDFGYIMLFDESSQELSVKSVKGLKKNYISQQTKISVQEGVIKWFTDWGNPVLLSDLDEQPVKEFLSTMSREIGPVITIAVPLVVKDKFVGLINLGEKESKEPFSKEDLRLLSTMGGPIAIALVNAELYVTVKNSEENLKLVNEELKKALEQEAALRGQLVNAERLVSLGEMAAKIAHEINNPLTVIKGQAEIQLMKVEDQEFRKTLKLILDKSAEVAELTRRYMDLGKPHDVKLMPILFSNVVKKTADSLKFLGLLKRIEMSESYLEDEPQIMGDEVSLEQVLRNLVINAAQAIPEYRKGEIAIGTKMANHGKSVEAYVSDNGMGIKEEDLEKIFNPYFTTKKEGVGTGLGLMISKEIVEVIHGGTINIESTLEKGTTIHVTLPIGKYTLKKKKILIVDDEAYITDIFSEYLSSKGFLIRISNNGKDALKVYAEFKPDLVLSDINMPEMNGLELHAEIEKINPKQPFIMITGAFLKPEELGTLMRKKVPQIIKPAELEKELWKVVKEQLEMNSD